MQGDMAVDRMEVEAVDEIFHNKLSRFIQFHFMHHLFHAMQTRTLRTEDWVFTLFAGFPKGCFEFSTLAVGYVEHALTLPNLSATHTFHALREDDLVASLGHQLDHLVHQVVNLSAMLGLSHSLVDTAGEIYYLEVGCLMWDV